MGRKTATRPPKIDPPPFDAALGALAGAQHGVFQAQQAVALGRSPRALRDRVTAGRLFRLHQGVYSLVPPRLLSVHGRRMAAVLAGGPGAALSHLSAAVHLGLVTTAAPYTPDVTVPRRSGHQRKRIRIHRSATLRAGDVVDAYGVPTTTVARTLLDIARTRHLEDAIDEAGRQDNLEIDALKAQITHNAGRREAVALGEAVNRYEEINALTESQLEKLFLTAMCDQGLPDPELQVWIDPGDGGKRIRADFLWRDARVIGEADGWKAHAGHFESDRERDQRAARAGYQTIRVTRRQVVSEAARLAATFRAVITQRSPHPPHPPPAPGPPA